MPKRLYTVDGPLDDALTQRAQHHETSKVELVRLALRQLVGDEEADEAVRATIKAEHERALFEPRKRLFELPDSLIDDLDQIAKSVNCSHSLLVRHALQTLLGARRTPTARPTPAKAVARGKKPRPRAAVADSPRTAAADKL